jgi:hypothetical protein
MSEKKKVLIISYSELKTDPRVLRQIEFLHNKFSIHTVGLCSAEHEGETEHTTISYSRNVTFHYSYTVFFRKLISFCYVMPLNFVRWALNYLFLVVLKKYELTYWSYWRRQTLKKLMPAKFDVVIANDVEALPLAVKLKQKHGGKIYFDAHEYSPLEYENNAAWLKQKSPYYTYLCKKYIPFSDYETTVSYGLAEAYKKLTGKHFDVVLNAPAYEKHTPSLNTTGVIRFMHHGGAAVDRNTDKLVRAFQQSERTDIELHLMIINLNSPYGEYIKELVENSSNIHFHPPVPTRDIASFINQFDVGIYFLPPLNFNQIYALPNKFFEFVQGRLMLAFGPSVEMEKYIKEYDLGVIGDGFDQKDIEKCINSITLTDVIKYKQNVNGAAKTLSAEESMNLVLTNISKLCAE